MLNKICPKCEKVKSLSHFAKCNNTKDGLYYICKECKKLLVTKYEVNVTEKKCRCCNIIKSSEEFSKHSYNRDGLKNECKLCVKDYNKKNKNYINKRNLQYFHTKGKELQRINRKKRRKKDPLFKLIGTIRSRIYSALKDNGFKKNTKTEQILGCQFEEFKTHIESQFEDWMSWNNHGNPADGIIDIGKTWDLDHIIPISTAITEEDVIRLNHYTNYQPLCSYTNRFIKRDLLM